MLKKKSIEHVCVYVYYDCYMLKVKIAVTACAYNPCS